MRLEQGTDDEEHDAHAHGRDEQRPLTPESIREEEHEDRGGDELDNAVDSGRKQRVRGTRVANLRPTQSQDTLPEIYRRRYSPTGRSGARSSSPSSGHSIAGG